MSHSQLFVNYNITFFYRDISTYLLQYKPFNTAFIRSHRYYICYRLLGRYQVPTYILWEAQHRTRARSAPGAVHRHRRQAKGNSFVLSPCTYIQYNIRSRYILYTSYYTFSFTQREAAPRAPEHL